MANVKSGRKKKLKTIPLAIIILVLVIATKTVATSWKQPEQEITKLPSASNVQNQSQSTEVSGNLKLYMIDVGQADSFLFVQDNHVALIDCGTRSTGKDAVQYIKNLGITKIDYVFGTHPHDDHMGGMYDIITNFEIGKIVLPKIQDGQITSNWYIKLMKEIMQGKYETEYSKTSNIYQLGDAVIKILWQSNEPQSNINNYSNIMKISFGEMDVIMTGDAEIEIEKEALNSEAELDAEIIKVGHHGSDTSSSEEFLDTVDPEYGLISTKIGNKYEHPNKKTMQKLQERDVIVYRTDECGTVIATISSNEIVFNCAEGDYLSGNELEEEEKAS